ncbi:MAG TPA: class I SAM-dependent methyltransferase [Gemmatimonadaceae bacterium]|nr:class I SAM-dependent methyltransferase [Gemmatimonadaceae bacterium]
MSDIRPLSHASTNDKVFELARPHLVASARVLDLGAGEGYFSSVVGAYLQRQGVSPARVLSACDAVPGQYRYGEVTCDPLGPGNQLPYDGAVFDLVCSLEVIEHVEDQFHFLREAYRVLRPGGTFIASTPNVLNMNSRWRALHSGFAQLFDPLPLDRHDVVHTSGHIHPVSYYYLAFALRRAGFGSVQVHFDRFKRSALVPLALLGIPMLLGHAGFLLRMRRKRPRELAQNRETVAAMNSLAMLTSRSIIVEAVK